MKLLVICVLMVAGEAGADSLGTLWHKARLEEARVNGTVWCCSTCGEPVKEISQLVTGYECGATRFVHAGCVLIGGTCGGWPVVETTRPATAEEIIEAKENKLPAWTVTSSFLVAVKDSWGRWVMRGTIQRERKEIKTRLAICPRGHISGRVQDGGR